MTVKARENEQEDKAWSLYLCDRTNMTAETFTPFSEFYKVERTPKAPPKTKEEIMEDVEEIQRLFAQGGGINGDI